MTAQTSQAQFQAERVKLEAERDSIVSSIRDLRRRAREKSLVAADTRQALPQAEIDFWQRGIAEQQTALMNVQARLGALNKQLRQEHASNNGSRTRELKPQQSANEEQKHAVFLSCFFQIAHDSLDPRQFDALKRGAEALAVDHQRMNASPRSAPGTGPRGSSPSITLSRAKPPAKGTP